MTRRNFSRFMSAPLEASGSLRSDELLEEELMSWFPNPDEQSSIAMKWFEAKILQSSDSSMASAAAWASGCRLIRAIKHNYSGVCKILDRLCEQLKSLQQTNQPKRKRNRTAPATAEKKNRTDLAASIHKEADRHLEPF